MKIKAILFHILFHFSSALKKSLCLASLDRNFKISRDRTCVSAQGGVAMFQRQQLSMIPHVASSYDM